MKNAPELSPCPFCGGSAEFRPYKRDGLTLKCKSLGCVVFNQRTLRYSLEWLQERMAEHWNTRASPESGWAPLTDEQIKACVREATAPFRTGEVWSPHQVRFVRAIEAAHGIAPAGGIGGE